MTLKFNCPGCSSQLEVQGAHQVGACPHCEHPISIKIIVSSTMELADDPSKTDLPKTKPSRPWKCSGVPHGVAQVAARKVG